MGPTPYVSKTQEARELDEREARKKERRERARMRLTTEQKCNIK